MEWVNEYGIALAVDAKGHLHKGKGEGGGQFAKGGGGDASVESASKSLKDLEHEWLILWDKVDKAARNGVRDEEGLKRQKELKREISDAKKKEKSVRKAKPRVATPPRKLSKEAKAAMTHTKEFKSWFGDWQDDPASASKVVNTDGEPQETHGTAKKVYHGSGARFDTFDKKLLKTMTVGLGFYFAEDKRVAGMFQGEDEDDETVPLYECYLNIRNPLDLDTEEGMKLWNDTRKAVAKPDELEHLKGNASVNAAIQAMGYDGIVHSSDMHSHIADPGSEYGKVWIALEPNQIKSTSASKFDPASENIHMSLTNALLANQIQRECLLESGGDVGAANAAGEYILAHGLVSLSVDDGGRAHAPKGTSEGGQFTKKGSNGGGKWVSPANTGKLKSRKVGDHEVLIDRKGIVHGGSIPRSFEGKHFSEVVFAHERGELDSDKKAGGADTAAIKSSLTRLNIQDPVTGMPPIVPKLEEMLRGEHPSMTRKDFHDIIEEMRKNDEITVQIWDTTIPLESTGYSREDFPKQGEFGHPVGWIKVNAPKKKTSTGLSINTFFAHDISNPRAQGVLNRSLKSVRGLTAAGKRDLAAALDQSTTDSGAAILDFVDKYRVQLAKLLTVTQLAALLEGAVEVARKVPQLDEDAAQLARYGTAPELPNFPTPDGIHLPVIEEAARSLAARNVMTRPEYDALDAAARAKAFTVAGVDAQATLSKVRDVMAENVEKGADYAAFKKDVLDAVGEGTFLSEPHLSTVFRTNVQSAFSDGQAKILANPVVRAGFPYAAYDAIHDDRVRDDHLALEHHGIGGTNVYRNDDPVFQLFRPPWDYNDRCSWTPLTIRQAAEQGIAEAKEWLRTGIEPTRPAHVAMPPFQPPPGFQRAVSAAPLSIQLSMQSMATFAVAEPKRKKDESERDDLIAEILVTMFGDDAEQVVESLYDPDGDIALSVGDDGMMFGPKVTRRYGRRPGPNWHPGGFSRFGTQIWLYGTGPAHAPAASPPVPATPPVAPPPPTIPPAPAPATTAPTATPPPTTVTPPVLPVSTFTPVPLPVLGQVGVWPARIASVAAYNATMTKIASGQPLTGPDKAALARQLTNMPVNLLRSLHSALGGTGAVANARVAVAAVRSILTSASTPPLAPVATPSLTPAPVAAPPAAPSPAPKVGDVVRVDPSHPAHGGLIGRVVSTTTIGFIRVDLGASGGGTHMIADTYLTVLAGTPLPTPAPTPPAPPPAIPATIAVGSTVTVSASHPYAGGQTGTVTGITPAGYVDVAFPSGSIRTIAPHLLTVTTPATPTSPAPAVSPLAALPAHLQGKAAQIRAIALAHVDGLISLTDAEKEMQKIGSTIPSKTDQAALTASLGGSAKMTDIVAAMSKSDPGHVGASPPGPPPRPNLMWNPSTHRWILIPVAAPPPPAAPAAPGAHYQPPPPDVAKMKVGPYGGVAPGNLAGIPPTVDHKLVGSFSNDPKTLSADFHDGSRPIGTTDYYGGTFAQFDHTTSGYKVVASWKYGAPAGPGSSAMYSIKVMDGAGKVVSEYKSSAARDEAYIRERAVQTANWLEGELAKIAAAKTKTPTTAPLAQFAWEYAQAAGIKPGTVPFDISDASPHGSANRAKMEGYLKSAFPKLIGTTQYPMHGGMDVVEHTMNIVHPANLRTAGLPSRDAELLRLGMLYHDVGKQYDPLDHEHPRKSATDAKDLLWQFGLSPQEVSDALAVIKWHDAYGDALKAGGGSAEIKDVAKKVFEFTDDSLSPAQRRAEALRINNLLMRAWQSDVSSMPGLTAKAIPGRPDLKVSGHVDVDTVGPAFEAKVANYINTSNSILETKSAPLPKQPPTVAVGTSPPNLVAPGLKWGELVQRHEVLPIGGQVPHGSTKVPPPEVYAEAHKNPDLNYARAFNMGYDGPTGQILTIYHGLDSANSPSANLATAAAILNTGMRPGSGSDNVFGHGIYAFMNGANEMAPQYKQDKIVTMEVHTGRIVDHDELQNTVIPAFKKAEPALYAELTSNYKHTAHHGLKTAAALWAGYSSISMKYYNREPAIVVLDPSRVKINGVVDGVGSGYKGTSIKTLNGTVKTPALTADQKKTPAGHQDHMPIDSSGKPKGWSGKARTT